jgi:hypothetical protein
MARGGRREGAGRPRGSKDKQPRLTAAGVARSVALSRKAVIKAGGILPLPYMLAVMNDPKQPQTRRDKMAIAAACFCHPRLTVYAETKRPSQMSDAELDKAIAAAEEDALRVGITRGRWPRTVQ